ncbi:DNA-binding transcriptional regulator, GntR family [Desulfonispora thiosulfatigenes DSM 11270]|uniref:DNA-binding transcriptional regulator, GntR family n=1 Tax=Desulfonispora thiosulfatigenes DSM 11270 TaxID=656914 RepID=A0A1W1VP75_DESTI|nr:GntR family transcriptional regulator [Desulfonispora thiosulfatigenes]SMB95126.1 DNA-binding transcriptional regulator, GntR family [Desulfonispora thiosulfatigenes DSM 11270]
MDSKISFRDQIINNIKSKIQYNELKPNEIINETQICNFFNVSRTPVREALIHLVADGILEKIPRKGYKVLEIDTKSKLDLYTIIATLDALAASLSVDNLTEDDIIKMHECVDKIEIAIKYTKYSDYYTLQDQFHKIYINKCDNPILIKMLNDLSLSPLHRSYISTDTDKLFATLKETNDEHRTIIKLFVEKDKEELEKYLRFDHWATKHPDMI